MTVTKLCSQCAAPATHGNRCYKHRKRKGPRTANQKALVGIGPLGRRWREVSADYLRTHPLCEEDCGRGATQVHHLDGRGPTGPRGFDRTNFKAMCASCHARLEVKLRRRDWEGHWLPKLRYPGGSHRIVTAGPLGLYSRSPAASRAPPLFRNAR